MKNDAFKRLDPSALDKFPQELKEGRRFVAWKIGYATNAKGETKPTKIPVNPLTGDEASNDDPTTWTTWSEAITYHTTHEDSHGIGRVFDGHDGVMGIDIDHKEGRSPDTVSRWLASLSSYTERSVSGNGYHVYVKAAHDLGGKHKRKNGTLGLELFKSNTFFTISGDRLDEYPPDVRPAQQAIDDLYASAFPDKKVETKPARVAQSSRNGTGVRYETPSSDHELWEHMRRSKNWSAIQELASGGLDGKPSESEADLALASHLAFWTGGDESRTERMFSGTTRGQREKWQNRPDYRDATISKACAGGEHWKGIPVEEPLPSDWRYPDPVPATGPTPAVEVVVAEEADEVEPTYCPPTWEEVLETVKGSPINTYMTLASEAGELPATLLLGNAIQLACLQLAACERTVGVQSDYNPRHFNTYLMPLAESGKGKGLTSDLEMNVAKKLGIYRLDGVSAAAIANDLTKDEKRKHIPPPHAPYGIYRINEIKRLLSTKDVVGTGLSTVFLSGYDEGRLTWTVSPNGRLHKVIVEPFYPSLLVEGQPALIESTYGTSNVDAGFIARFLVVSVPEGAPRAHRRRTIDIDRVCNALRVYGPGPLLIVRPPELPESGRVNAVTLTDAEEASWSRLRGDYLPRIAAILDPKGCEKGIVEQSSMDRALVVVEWFLGQSMQLLGLMHGDKLAMLISRLERAIARRPGITDRELYRNLDVDHRTFQNLADTLRVRGVREVYETKGHRRRMWFPADPKSVGPTVSKPADTFLPEPQAVTNLSTDQTTTHTHNLNTMSYMGPPTVLQSPLNQQEKCRPESQVSGRHFLPPPSTVVKPSSPPETPDYAWDHVLDDIPGMADEERAEAIANSKGGSK